jgi:hypothetical protein
MFLAPVALVVIVGGMANADDQSEAGAILDRAIKATGGEAALSKVKATRCKAKGTGYEGDKKVPVSYEWAYEGFDKMRTVIFDPDGKKVQGIEVVNGKEGWAKDTGQQTEELSKEQVESRLETTYVSWVGMLAPLKGKGFRLAPLGEARVLGREAVGILVRHDLHGPVKLFFDKESNLLVKYERRFGNVEAGKEFTEETVYSDFKDVQGTQQPFKLTTFWDGVKIADLSITEMELSERPLDEKLFSKP